MTWLTLVIGLQAVCFILLLVQGIRHIRTEPFTAAFPWWVAVIGLGIVVKWLN